jgi:hypothetical protein
MSHQVCHDVSEWVEENVSQPVQRCVEQDCNWWCLCCNKWFCFIVWILVTIGNWVVHAVCELVADAVDIVVGVVTGLFDIIVGIITLDPARIWDGFLEIIIPVVKGAVDVFRIGTGGDLIGFFVDETNKWRLRNYVRGLVDGNRAYTGDQRRRIKSALGIDEGSFGLRLRVSALRSFVRSDAQAIEAAVPDLVSWHNDPNLNTKVDLKILAGFDSTGFWQRGRPQIVADDGSGFSASDLDAYLANPTAGDVRHFSIFCMSTGVLDDKLATAVVAADGLGLKLRFVRSDVQLTGRGQARVAADDASTVTVLTNPPFNRALESRASTAAQDDLCMPVAIGTFLFNPNTFRGFSAHLHPSACFDDANLTTGALFRDNVPDIIWKYVPIHELGHTFGLCHVDGIDHIMFGPKDKSWFDWTFIPQYLWLGGEPSFTFNEAKATWDYIIANFSAECLATRQF